MPITLSSFKYPTQPQQPYQQQPQPQHNVLKEYKKLSLSNKLNNLIIPQEQAFPPIEYSLNQILISQFALAMQTIKEENCLLIGVGGNSGNSGNNNNNHNRPSITNDNNNNNNKQMINKQQHHQQQQHQNYYQQQQFFLQNKNKKEDKSLVNNVSNKKTKTNVKWYKQTNQTSFTTPRMILDKLLQKKKTKATSPSNYMSSSATTPTPTSTSSTYPLPLAFAYFQSYYKQKQYKRAINICNQHLQRKHTHNQHNQHIIHYNMSYLHRLDGNLKQALFYLQLTLKEKPFFVYAIYDYAFLLGWNNRIEQGFNLVKRHLSQVYLPSQDVDDSDYLQSMFLKLAVKMGNNSSNNPNHNKNNDSLNKQHLTTTQSTTTPTTTKDVLITMNKKNISLVCYYNLGIYLKNVKVFNKAQQVFEEIIQCFDNQLGVGRLGVGYQEDDDYYTIVGNGVQKQKQNKQKPSPSPSTSLQILQQLLSLSKQDLKIYYFSHINLARCLQQQQQLLIKENKRNHNHNNNNNNQNLYNDDNDEIIKIYKYKSYRILKKIYTIQKQINQYQQKFDDINNVNNNQQCQKYNSSSRSPSYTPLINNQNNWKYYYEKFYLTLQIKLNQLSQQICSNGFYFYQISAENQLLKTTSTTTMTKFNKKQQQKQYISNTKSKRPLFNDININNIMSKTTTNGLKQQQKQQSSQSNRIHKIKAVHQKLQNVDSSKQKGKMQLQSSYTSHISIQQQRLIKQFNYNYEIKRLQNQKKFKFLLLKDKQLDSFFRSVEVSGGSCIKKNGNGSKLNGFLRQQQQQQQQLQQSSSLLLSSTLPLPTSSLQLMLLSKSKINQINSSGNGGDVSRSQFDYYKNMKNNKKFQQKQKNIQQPQPQQQLQTQQPQPQPQPQNSLFTYEQQPSHHNHNPNPNHNFQTPPATFFLHKTIINKLRKQLSQGELINEFEKQYAQKKLKYEKQFQGYQLNEALQHLLIKMKIDNNNNNNVNNNQSSSSPSPPQQFQSLISKQKQKVINNNNINNNHEKNHYYKLKNKQNTSKFKNSLPIKQLLKRRQQQQNNNFKNKQQLHSITSSTTTKSVGNRKLLFAITKPKTQQSQRKQKKQPAGATTTSSSLVTLNIKQQQKVNLLKKQQQQHHQQLQLQQNSFRINKINKLSNVIIPTTNKTTIEVINKKQKIIQKNVQQKQHLKQRQQQQQQQQQKKQKLLKDSPINKEKNVNNNNLQKKKKQITKTQQSPPQPPPKSPSSLKQKDNKKITKVTTTITAPSPQTTTTVSILLNIQKKQKILQQQLEQQQNVKNELEQNIYEQIENKKIKSVSQKQQKQQQQQQLYQQNKEKQKVEQQQIEKQKEIEQQQQQYKQKDIIPIIPTTPSSKLFQINQISSYRQNPSLNPNTTHNILNNNKSQKKTITTKCRFQDNIVQYDITQQQTATKKKNNKLSQSHRGVIKSLKFLDDNYNNNNNNYGNNINSSDKLKLYNNNRDTQSIKDIFESFNPKSAKNIMKNLYPSSILKNSSNNFQQNNQQNNQYNATLKTLTQSSKALLSTTTIKNIQFDSIVDKDIPLIPNEFKQQFQQAEKLQQQQKYHQAFDIFTTLYKHYKEVHLKQMVLLGLAYNFQLQGQYQQAQKTYIKCTKYKSNWQAFMKLGQLHIRNNKIQSGIENLQKANCIKRFHKQIQTKLVYAYSLQQQTVQKALALANSILKRDPLALDILIMTASILQKQGKIKQALDICLAIDTHKQSQIIKHYIGILYLSDSNVIEAFKYFKGSLSIKSNHVPSLIQIGTILSQIKPKQAISFFTKAINIDPNNRLALTRLAKIYQSIQHDNEKAMQTYKKALSTKQNYQSYMKIGNCFENQNAYLQALVNYKQALALKKTHTVYRKIAEMYSYKCEYARAIENYQLALEYLPNENKLIEEKKAIQIQLAKHMLLIQDFEKAIGVLEDLLERDDDTQEIYSLLGQSYFGKGEFSVALEYYEKANSLSPTAEDIDILEKMALCFDKKQEYNASRQIYQKILQQDPDNSKCINNLSNVLLILGYTNQAFYWFELLLEKYPKNLERRIKVSDIYSAVGDWSKVEYHLLICFKQKQHDIKVLERLVALYKEKRQPKQLAKYQKKLALVKLNKKGHSSSN